ncbi:L-threonylcarbamoyladenylate synthase [Verrucosispora sp. WMMA2044]|uniref:Threonylcarbamoyl-AMP synthase n=1 Tax=Verrucosispora sioxanthis TaxID=2499994 RepID=A0A6M1L994_9ACTN|nr:MULTISPECIES: L-threonylcarbamoyladenylate synthase [Micromonospora]NEE65765.1 threonylcarbamoyl-AMP synthase [Verrucosispora sioxanthis]NGM14875.1 threonylcarbamoyl-AMP synthase [Verrucosispora sioxanthis]WBB51875.1 L-threonylcarbamoyladenylate synthase [Verrucosispora sp. WMMA2044]
MPADGDLGEASAVLRTGGLVAFPTETVYGLGANALDARAAARIFEAKQRPSFDPLITHLADAADLEPLVGPVSPAVAALAARFWPGPLTLIVDRPAEIPPIVTSGLDSMAVRVPDHEHARRLIAAAGVPVAAPSANRFGQLSPTRAEHVVRGLGAAVDMVLDGGPTRCGIESTIVDARGDHPVVLRLGALPVEELEKVTGPVTVRPGSSGQPVAPGTLAAHYAPRTPLRLVSGAGPVGAGRGYLAFRDRPAGDWAAVEVLSASGDLTEAAARLFDALHRLDAARVTEIVAEPVPDTGVGRAVNDRLRRAAATWDPAAHEQQV